MSRPARGLVPLLALATACLGHPPSPLPNFGDLVPEERTFDVHRDVRMLELSNGMVVALVPDERTNVVTVDVRYRVGASQDPDGRVGLAHLVEHLTFQTPADDSGASLFDRFTTVALSFDAYTSHDVTHYTSTAPAEQLDALLALEARRLGGHCATIPDAVFVRERDVVLEEDAQRGGTWPRLLGEIGRAVWGPRHPYGRPIGSRDVASATLAEACAFVAAHYTPARAILVVTGPIELATLQPRIARAFGALAEPRTTRLAAVPAARLRGTTSDHAGDIPHPTVVIAAPAPPWGDDDEATHEAVMAAVTGALRQLDERHAWILDTGVGYGGDGHQRVTVLVLELADAARFDEAVTAALRAAQHAFTDGEDDPTLLQWRVGALRGALQTRTVTAHDRSRGRGVALADYLTFTDHYDFALARMRANDAITSERLIAHARETFAPEHVHVARVRPSGATGDGDGARRTLAATTQAYDLPVWRSPVDATAATGPEPLPPPSAPPRVDAFTLDNGLRVLMYAEPRAAGFEARLVIPRGRVDETAPGVAEAAAEQLDHDYARRYPPGVVQTVIWALRLGTQLEPEIGMETTEFTSRGLAMFADWHLWRLAWLVDQGVYSQDALATWRRELREGDDREASPSTRAFAQRLFGVAHPYARPRPRRDELARLGRRQLEAWRRANYSLAGATLVVSGGFLPAAMRAHVTTLFGAIVTPPPAPRPPLPPIQPAAGPSWLGTVQADAPQVTLSVSFAAASERDRDHAARRVLEAMLHDRLRQVREGLGASYGLRVAYTERPAGSTLDLVGALDPAHAPRAAAAVLATLAALRAETQTAAADFVRARRRVVDEALASSADAEEVAERLAIAVRHGGDLRSLERVADELAAVTLDAVAAVAARDLDPARMVVSVDGRQAAVTATLDALHASHIEWFTE